MVTPAEDWQGVTSGVLKFLLLEVGKGAAEWVWSAQHQKNTGIFAIFQKTS
jgi:hypothetical protein